MTRNTYEHSDMQAITATTRTLEEIAGMPWREFKYAGEAFTLLAAESDVPIPLRRYYSKFGKLLAKSALHLKNNLDDAIDKGERLSQRISSTLDRTLKLTESDMYHLIQINQRLQDLEKSLQLMLEKQQERMDGVFPTGVNWDDWDSSEINLWLEFDSDAARPAYDSNAWNENRMMEPLKIRIKLWCSRKRSSWGLYDGKNHGDRSGCTGSPLQYFHQCYLFHEIFDHAEVGIWGMLHLRSLWIELTPHRSGDFVI